MPPTAAERRAVLAHAALIDQYDADVSRERERLFRGWRKVCAPDFTAGLPGCTGYRGCADPLRWARTRLRVRRIIDAQLACYEAARRPPVDPLDSSRRLVAWIDGHFQRWERIPGLLALSPLGRAAMEADPARFPPPSPTGASVYPLSEATDVYRAALGRAHAFARLVPSSLADLPAGSDPVLGLREIRAYFALLAEVPPEPGPPSEDEDPAVPSPEPLAIALDLLAGSPRSRELVAYLANRDGRRASLDQLAIDLDGARPATALRRRDTIRTRFERTRNALESRAAPLRLCIDHGVVRLTAPPSSGIRPDVGEMSAEM